MCRLQCWCKIRPLLVKCKDEEIKNRIFGRVSELKSADMRFRGVSISHDLTPRQREHVKEVRKKAMEEPTGFLCGWSVGLEFLAGQLA